MTEKNIGYTPESTINNSTPATLPEARNTRNEAKTNIQFKELNKSDLLLSAMDETLLNAIACKMAEKGISAESISSTL